MIEPGDIAPLCSGIDQHGNDVALADYHGQWVVVWFIPSTMASMTPACCDHIAEKFGAAVEEHPELNVIGVTFDTPQQVRDFARRALVFFPVLSDTTKEVGEAWGVRRGEGVEWDCFPMKRAFLVSPSRVVARRYDNIDPDLFVDEVVADLAELAPKKGWLRRLVGAG